MEQSSKRLTVTWIILAFIAWIFAFQGFLSSKFVLISDALSYYDHTKFFIDNWSHGVYPLWDPTWFSGAPNDFFLRRIGSFNPFYLLIILFKSFGIPYTLSYLWFLALYYGSGMIAFYLLAMRLYQDRLIAYGGYLILLFSALGTRLFDSYMMLITVPLIWFFFFLVAFYQTPRKCFFLGMILAFMVLASTYIPFYFLIILGLFVILFSLLYIDYLPRVFSTSIIFFKKNKILVFLSFFVLLFSFLPIVLFFYDSVHGHAVLPLRHGGMNAADTLTVPHQTLDWGMIEDLMYSYYFSNLRLFKFAVVYVPFFSIIVFALGLIGRMNRRAVLMFLWSLVLFCSIVPHGLPFYDFLYKHIFLLKYFRNLHFFIWFFFIPLFVMLVLEHWKIFTDLTRTHHKALLLAYVIGIHLIIGFFIWWRRDAIPSTYLMLGLSLIFWTLRVLNRISFNFWSFFLLTLTVLIQPLEAYHYFSLKSLPYTHPYSADAPNKFIINYSILPQPGALAGHKDALYYVSGEYNLLYQNVSDYSLQKYIQHKLIIVDYVQFIDRQDYEMIEKRLLSDANVALAFSNKVLDKTLLGPYDPNPLPQAQYINDAQPGFKVLAYDANHLRLKLTLPYQKFLIYNDNYDPYWKVFVNHQVSQLYEVNGAFKGVWVPAGESTVEFRYGNWWQYTMNILLSIFAFALLLGIIFYSFKGRD